MSGGYTTRTLPREEWPRLSETDLPALLPYLPADAVDVVVVERDGCIVACWAVTRIVHLEGVWIAPAYRQKPSVAKRLMTATLDVARRHAPAWVLSAAADDRVRRLLERHMGATRVPSDTYLIPLYGEAPVCRYLR